MNGTPSELAIMEAEAIRRLSALERLRDKARAGNRDSMLASVERMIEDELRMLRKIRANSGSALTQVQAVRASERPGSGSPERSGSPS